MSNNETKYFDLHANGLGYLNRAREVKVRGGKPPMLCVDISALRGSAEKAEYTWFDCRVSGADAQIIVKQLMPDITEGKAVLVGFKISDMYAEAFTYKTGEKAGQAGVSLKARLLKIDWVKVDGQSIPLETLNDQSQKTA